MRTNPDTADARRVLEIRTAFVTEPRPGSVRVAMSAWPEPPEPSSPRCSGPDELRGADLMSAGAGQAAASRPSADLGRHGRVSGGRLLRLRVEGQCGTTGLRRKNE